MTFHSLSIVYGIFPPLPYWSQNATNRAKILSFWQLSMRAMRWQAPFSSALDIWMCPYMVIYHYLCRMSSRCRLRAAGAWSLLVFRPSLLPVWPWSDTWSGSGASPQSPFSCSFRQSPVCRSRASSSVPVSERGENGLLHGHGAVSVQRDSGWFESRRTPVVFLHLAGCDAHGVFSCD